MLYFIQTVLSVFLIWSFIVAVAGTIAHYNRKRSADAGKKYSYAVLICAHNEENVIDNLLTCLEEQEYPADKVHIYLLADHCTDQTVAIGKKHTEVTVWERNDGERSGKGAVLHWGIKRLQDEEKGKFENIVLFDADNVIEPQFIATINNYFATGADIVTGKRISQNPFADLVSQWYTLYWCIVNSLYNRPRYRLGLSAMISGTGFAFKKELLDGEGWNTFSLSEDIEFSCQQVLRGKQVDFAETALFYDEQPTDFKVMTTQLSRWCTGNFQIVAHYFKAWMQAFLREPNVKLTDLFMTVGFTVVIGAVALFYILLMLGLLFEGMITILIVPGIGMYIATCLVGLAAAYLDGWSVSKLWKGIVTFPVFYVTLSLVSLKSFFFPERQWVNIVHKGAGVQAFPKVKGNR
jgi:cellulose synthase/poly-beta-1,6-N-acetylglucosamine synthase-like glycosyltransferase